MDLKTGVGIALGMCAAAEAAEPTAPAAVAERASRPATQPPLDLRVGDIRKYMMPREFRAAVGAPDPDRDTVVVEGTILLPMKSMQPVPGGLASLWWAAKNPLQSWRIFAPVVNAPEFPNYNKVPPPIFRWGP